MKGGQSGHDTVGEPGYNARFKSSDIQWMSVLKFEHIPLAVQLT